MPGIDSSRYPGYELTTVLHIIDFIFTGMGLSFYELQILAISFNTTLMGDIIIFKLKKADKNKDTLGKELKEIIKLYIKDYADLIKAFSASYNILIATKFLTAVMNISFALFVIQLVSFFLQIHVCVYSRMFFRVVGVLVTQLWLQWSAKHSCMAL